MNGKSDIEKQVQQTMAMFDETETLPPDPNFYTHMTGRLRDQTETRPLFAVLKPILLSSLVVLNLITAARYLSGDDSQSITDPKQTLMDLIAEDLDIEVSQSDIFNF